ncbi:sugar phosphate isomerase/epimerase [Aerococcaceae bacterium zg-BR22]|uniref:TIM barrel protein n=1 Tax=Aerococcaceae bacterium zg-1292 TaxID=2774330 RepID=UPI004064018F|nr:sugar phosphate isomerase/epimerase [Aerococcaceae bacterium zg-BR22]
MKLATRLNSVLKQNGDVLETLNIIGKIKQIEEVDLNYPEHFEKNSIEEISGIMKENNLKLNGIALRFRDEFINGDLGNVDEFVHNKAVTLCEEAIHTCRALNGKVITLWLGHDGFDYPFQIDYEKTWEKVRNTIKSLASCNPDILFSIEYKPYEERAFALIDSFGMTMHMINQINLDNVGITLDYCHMLMKKENPALGVALAQSSGKLFGIHLNDGYSFQDNGLMIGTGSLFQTYEFLYYVLEKSRDITIYFDTFPIRENPIEEIKQNVAMLDKMESKLNSVGLDNIRKVIEANNGVDSHKLLIELI